MKLAQIWLEPAKTGAVDARKTKNGQNRGKWQRCS